jgi:hypothetical protein
MEIGSGEKMVVALALETAWMNAPSVVFTDEFQASNSSAVLSRWKTVYNITAVHGRCKADGDFADYCLGGRLYLNRQSCGCTLPQQIPFDGDKGTGRESI